MTRRIINKAYNDLVGGAVSEPVGISADIRNYGSVLRATSNDLRRSSKLVEARTFDTQRKTPLQTDRGGDDNPEEKRGRIDFTDIDGDGSAMGAEVSAQEQDTIPPTAYRMKSFMSSLDFGLRANPPTPTKATHTPSKPLHQEDPHRNPKMFLPKGINQSNQPYVAPKFLPTYRDMMQTMVKPDPLVSIVETTPPSMQKWAIEWNNEPKRAISIDELKEDLLREANERALKESKKNQNQWMNFKSNESSEEVTEEENIDQNGIGGSAMTSQSISKRVEKPRPIVPEYERIQPWKYVPVPSVKGTRAEEMVGPAQEEKTIGQSLAEWVPPKYRGSNKNPLNDPLAKPYSFRDAIARGTVVKMGASEGKNASPKLIMSKAGDKNVYLDTDQEKFHEWFRKRMSAAVQSAVQPKKVPMKQAAQAIKVPPPTPTNRIKPQIPTLPEDDDDNRIPSSNHIRNISQNESWKDLEKLGMIPVEYSYNNHPVDNVSNALREQNKSSFSNWLKVRGNYVVKTGPNPPVKKEEIVPTQKQAQNMRFPWSVSYMLHKKALPPQKPQQPSKNVKKLPKSVPDDSRIKYAKMSMKKSNRSPTLRRGCSHTGQTTADTYDRRSIKSPQKKAVDTAFVKRNPDKKAARRELSIAAALTNQIGIKDWGNELDHINTLRRTDTPAHTCRGSNAKKLFSPLGGTQMKYWEAKYSKKSVFPQIQRASHSNSSAKTSPYYWFTPRKEIDYEKGKRAPFSAIDEQALFPLTLPQYAESEDVDFSKDLYNLDVNNFFKEDAEREADEQETALDGQSIEKMQGEDVDYDESLIQRVKRKLEDDELALAFGEDAGEEDMEWSEFIGSKNNYEEDDDLATLISGKIGSVHAHIDGQI